MHMKNSRNVRESAQFSHVKLFETPRTAAYQVPPSMGFARQGYWSGLPLPSPITKFSQFSSFTQSCQTLCDPMNPSMPGLPVHHQLSEFTQTHVHRVRDAIQPSHPLSSPLLLPPIPLRIRVFSNESTLHMRWPKYWSFSFQHQSFQWTPRTDFI